MDYQETTIARFFRESAEKYGSKRAVVYKENSYSWQELDVLSDLAADMLARQGLGPGDRVGLCAPNSDRWIICFLALQKLGAIPALLNPGFRGRELSKVIRIGDLNWLCYGEITALSSSGELPQKVRALADEGRLRTVDIRSDALPLKQLAAAGSARRPLPDGSCRDICCLLYTSGSTKDPKCVQHCHYSLINNALVSAERARMGPEDRLCLSQPLFHMFGFAAAFLASVSAGTTMFVLDHFGSQEILECVDHNRCTILNGVPTNFLRLLSNPVFPNYRTDSLRLSVIGGAPLSVEQLKHIRRAFPSVHFMSNYGLTEGCCLCNSEWEDDGDLVAETVGRAYPGVELAIYDRKSGAFLPAGARGEIVARGYSVMQGYYKPEGEQPIDEDGWLHTEDLGILDEKGYVHIVGRIKDIIIRGGEDITPEEIRSEILRYEPVRDCLVFGAPHPILGEEVVACLVLDAPEKYDEAELRALLARRLSRYKIPAFLLVYDEFPVVASGKVDRRGLRKDLEQKVAELHKGDAKYNISPQIPGAAH